MGFFIANNQQQKGGEPETKSKMKFYQMFYQRGGPHVRDFAPFF